MRIKSLKKYDLFIYKLKSKINKKKINIGKNIKKIRIYLHTKRNSYSK